MHSPLPTWREFTAGGPCLYVCVYMCVCVYVCEGAGGWFRAWVHLSTLLLFDGTQRAFIHYSWHAEGATLGQGFGKSKSEPVIMSSVHVCGGVYVYVHMLVCVCVSLQKRLISCHCQDWAGHSDTSRKSHGARAAGKIMCICVWEHMCTCVCMCVCVCVCVCVSVCAAGQSWIFLFLFARQWRGIWTYTDCRRPSEALLSQQSPNSTTQKKKKTLAWSAQNLFHWRSFFWRHWDADFIRGTNTVSCSHEINSAGCRATVKIIQRPTSSTWLGEKSTREARYKVSPSQWAI